jgi:hypothetical protein
LAYIVPEKEIKNCIVDFNEKTFNQYLDEWWLKTIGGKNVYFKTWN